MTGQELTLTWPDRARYAGFEALHRAPNTIVLITLNGERYELEEPVSVVALLEKLEIDPRRVAVEHNFTILKRHRFPEVVVSDGDSVEIVNFVGGG